MSKIYSFITEHSEKLWEYLSEVFRFGLKSSELGITDDLVFQIMRYYEPYNAVEVYILHGKKESIFGADIELYIEKPNNDNQISEKEYYGYILQAKVMNKEGYFKEIKSKGSDKQQWDKLLDYAKVKKTTPLYLLYSGLTPNSDLGEATLGTSIIHAKNIKSIIESGGQLIIFINNINIKYLAGHLFEGYKPYKWTKKSMKHLSISLNQILGLKDGPGVTLNKIITIPYPSWPFSSLFNGDFTHNDDEALKESEIKINFKKYDRAVNSNKSTIKNDNEGLESYTKMGIANNIEPQFEPTYIIMINHVADNLTLES